MIPSYRTIRLIYGQRNWRSFKRNFRKSLKVASITRNLKSSTGLRDLIFRYTTQLLLDGLSFLKGLLRENSIEGGRNEYNIFICGLGHSPSHYFLHFLVVGRIFSSHNSTEQTLVYPCKRICTCGNLFGRLSTNEDRRLVIY